LVLGTYTYKNILFQLLNDCLSEVELCEQVYGHM
jgi:hypothetical protein